MLDRMSSTAREPGPSVRREELSPEALARLRRRVAIALVSLAVICIVVTFAETWPVPWIDQLGQSWFGRSSLRWRIGGVFVLLGGGILLPILLVAVALKRLLRRPAR
jgi:hypothetical protein